MGFMSFRSILLLVLILCSCHATVPLLANSLFPSLPSSSCPEDERSALIQFKQSFFINCDVSEPSAYPKVRSWAYDGGNCCHWEGVTCDKETGHVIGIDLGSSCLYGSFPSNSTLFTLLHLQELSLNDNHFNCSQIPPEIGLFTKLKILNLGRSVFSGQIPLEISTLSQLSFLDLSGSLLKLKEPGFDKLVGNLTSLNQLILNLVDISSPVPIMLANLTSLRALSLQLCNLYGDFPVDIFHLPHLEVLDLTENVNLAGFLPEFQPNTPLRGISTFYTSFYGKIPSSIGELTHMKELVLHGCHFYGPIPSTLGNLTRLTVLDLFHNNLNGDIPSSLTNLTHLQKLALSDLVIEPEKLTSWLSKQRELAVLGLNNIRLASETLSSIANITNLRVLELSGNQLTSQFPNWLMNLTQLEKMSLMGNHLKGTIPAQEILKLANLESLSLAGNDNLHGILDSFLKLKSLDDLDLSGIKLTSLDKGMANESLSKLIFISLNSCNLSKFPASLYSQDKLQHFSLNDNNIHGLIPQWFVNVTRESLRNLDLSHNFLTGFAQPIMVLPWTRLEVLNLQNNQLKGSLPVPSISLQIYQVSNNLFTGSIPTQICHSAHSIKYFDVAGNSLSGKIPECLSRLGSSLLALNLKDNNFDGSIPGAYPKSCSLELIDFSNNKLHGAIPRSLVNCIDLQVLDIGKNHINDTFPSWLGNLPKLHTLILRRNSFHGRIGRPKDDLQFLSLRIIDLSNNFHTGDLPHEYLQNWDSMKITSKDPEVTFPTKVPIDIYTPNEVMSYNIEYNNSITITNKGNDLLYSKVLTVFRFIDFSSNQFTGTISYSIGDLTGLQALNLSNNHLVGRIPSSLGNIRCLESLDLSNNMLSEEIPTLLTQLTFLEVLNVSCNHLSGPIPQGRQFGTFDNSSFFGNSELCGPPLSKKCGHVRGPPTSVSEKETEEDSKLIDWIITGSGYLGGFAVGCALGKYITDRNHEWFLKTFERTGRPLKTRARKAPRRQRS